MADCTREPEVLECAMSGRPAGVLADHIAGCASCRDLFEAARAVITDRTALVRDAHPPSAGLTWWRIKMREQREAERAAVRTGAFVQAALLVAAICAALAILGLSIDVHAVLASVIASAGRFAIPALAVVAWLILAPVALYFAVTDR